MISRRGYFGFAVCACAVADGFAAGAEPLPANYTAPTHVSEPGKAPGMQTQVISGKTGDPRSWAIILSSGDEVISGLSDWMAKERIAGAHLTAIGAYSSALFGWFDKDKRAYRNIVAAEQVECISLIGDPGLVDGKPALRMHGCVGHLLSAVAFPTLEVFATESEMPLHKQKDPAPRMAAAVAMPAAARADRCGAKPPVQAAAH